MSTEDELTDAVLRLRVAMAVLRQKSPILVAAVADAADRLCDGVEDILASGHSRDPVD